MVDLDTGELRIPPRIQKDYSNENAPDPATFALDQSGDLRTVRILRAHVAAGRESVALFPSQKATRMTGKGINDVVKRLAARAEVEPYTYSGRGNQRT